MAAAARAFLLSLAAAGAVRVIENLDFGGTECSAEQKVAMTQRFSLEDCSLDGEEESLMYYGNPEAPGTMALYLYPMDDHNGAFGLCHGVELSAEFCSRIYQESEHYTIMFLRVNTVEEATAFVRQLPHELVIKHLVLGGHGDETSLQWGEWNTTDGTPGLMVGNAASGDFFDSVYPLLRTGGEDPSTVFLDACLNAKEVCHMNMLQYVAHQLAGARVLGSSVSWSNDQLFLSGNGKHFGAEIVHKGGNAMREARFGEALRYWSFATNAYCEDEEGMERKEGVESLEGCKAACVAEASCKAFVYYNPKKAQVMGKEVHLGDKKCLLSKDCEKLGRSQQGALVFYKGDEE